jgi:hypothetical protein
MRNKSLKPEITYAKSLIDGFIPMEAKINNILIKKKKDAVLGDVLLNEMAGLKLSLSQTLDEDNAIIDEVRQFVAKYENVATMNNMLIINKDDYTRLQKVLDMYIYGVNK